MCKRGFLSVFLFCFPVFASAATPQKAADEVLSASSMDEKCEIFFEHFMGYAIEEDFSSSDRLIAIIDREDSGLVDYCDARRSKYLKSY